MVGVEGPSLHELTCSLEHVSMGSQAVYCDLCRGDEITPASHQNKKEYYCTTDRRSVRGYSNLEFLGRRLNPSFPW